MHMHMRRMRIWMCVCMCTRSSANQYAAYTPSQTAFAAHACLARGQAPLSLSMATEELYDVDDGPLLRKRRMVMTMCTVQIVVSLALLANARRNLVLLVLNPFFVAAGALGYVGAKRCQPLLVMAHFLGSAGLSLLFGLFVLAEVRARKRLFVLNRLPPTAHPLPAASLPGLPQALRHGPALLRLQHADGPAAPLLLGLLRLTLALAQRLPGAEP